MLKSSRADSAIGLIFVNALTAGFRFNQRNVRKLGKTGGGGRGLFG